MRNIKKLKRLFVAVQILAVAALGAWIAYTLLKPAQKPEYDRDAWRSWKGFFALSYQGIAKKDGKEYVSEAELGSQLAALRKAGFHTITPDDAVRFLEGRKPLPEKALLLIFEGGRKDSLLSATPYLRKERYSAVMCVPTKVTDAWENFYLSARELKSVSDDPAWSLCSMGHRAIEMIPVDASGGKDHFLTGLLRTAKGVENEKEFAERVVGDYEEAYKIIEKATGRPAQAYLYPYADAGENRGPRSPAAEVNLQAVKRCHKMAFVRGDSAFNGWGSDPYRLNRLRVPPGWDSGRLLKELERYEPRTAAPEAFRSPADWTVSGDVNISDNALRAGPGAHAFFRGADEWQNVDVKVNIRLEQGGTAFVYGRYVSPRSYVRLSLHKSGVRLQECSGPLMQTLAWHPMKVDETKPHLVALRIKGNRVWAAMDGAALGGAEPLAPSIGRGRVGLGSQDGPVEFSSLTAEEIPFRYLFADSLVGLPRETVRQAGAILPVWFRDGVTPGRDGARTKEMLVAASQGIATIPIVEAGKELPPDRADAFAGQIAAVLGDPLVKPCVDRVALRSPGNALVSRIRAKGFKVIRIVSVPEARDIASKGVGQEDGDMILVEGDGKEAVDVIRELLRSIPSERLIAPVDTKAAIELGVGMVIRPSKSKEGNP